MVRAVGVLMPNLGGPLIRRSAAHGVNVEAGPILPIRQVPAPAKTGPSGTGEFAYAHAGIHTVFLEPRFNR